MAWKAIPWELHPDYVAHNYIRWREWKIDEALTEAVRNRIPDADSAIRDCFLKIGRFIKELSDIFTLRLYHPLVTKRYLLKLTEIRGRLYTQFELRAIIDTIYDYIGWESVEGDMYDAFRRAMLHYFRKEDKHSWDKPLYYVILLMSNHFVRNLHRHFRIYLQITKEEPLEGDIPFVPVPSDKDMLRSLLLMENQIGDFDVRGFSRTTKHILYMVTAENYSLSEAITKIRGFKNGIFLTHHTAKIKPLIQGYR